MLLLLFSAGSLPLRSQAVSRAGHSLRVCSRSCTVACMSLVAVSALPSRSQQTADRTQKSLEDLMNIEVTSLSKKEQKTSQAPTAIFVISREDIQRSSALTIPDLLRMSQI